MHYWDLIEHAYDSVNIYDGEEIFFEGFGRLTLPIQHLLASHWCQSEANNGGLNQFFFNPTGVLAPEAVEGFVAIGATEVAAIVSEGMRELGPHYPRDQSQRRAAMERLPHRVIRRGNHPSYLIVDRFDSLTDRLFKVLPCYDAMADAYAVANAHLR